MKFSFRVSIYIEFQGVLLFKEPVESKLSSLQQKTFFIISFLRKLLTLSENSGKTLEALMVISTMIVLYQEDYYLKLFFISWKYSTYGNKYFLEYDISSFCVYPGVKR